MKTPSDVQSQPNGSLNDQSQTKPLKGTLDQWYIVERNNPYIAPENIVFDKKSNYTMRGILNDNISDLTETSYILKINLDDMTIETKNSQYKLLNIDEHFSEIWKRRYKREMAKDGMIVFTVN